MFRTIYARLGIISAIATLALLVALPRIPITAKNSLINIDSSIGGYYLNFLDGRFVLNLTEFKKGLDLKGGVRIVLKADMSKIDTLERDKALNSAKDIIERRVNLLGVSEPYIASTKIGDEYRIIVEIPGIDDVSSAVDLIGQTAQLRFKQLPAIENGTKANSANITWIRPLGKTRR